MSAQLGWAPVRHDCGMWARVHDDSGMSSTTVVNERQSSIVSCTHAVRELLKRRRVRLREQRHRLATPRSRGVGTPRAEELLTTSLRGLWGDGRRPENRPNSAQTAPRHQKRYSRTSVGAPSGEAQRPWCAKGRGPKDLASRRHCCRLSRQLLTYRSLLPSSPTFLSRPAKQVPLRATLTAQSR